MLSCPKTTWRIGPDEANARKMAISTAANP